MRIQARHPHAGEIPLFCGFSAGVFPFSVSVERVPSEKVLAPFQLRQHDMSDEYTSARILARRRWRSFRATFSSTTTTCRARWRRCAARRLLRRDEEPKLHDGGAHGAGVLPEVLHPTCSTGSSQRPYCGEGVRSQSGKGRLCTEVGGLSAFSARHIQFAQKCGAKTRFTQTRQDEALCTNSCVYLMMNRAIRN